MAFIFLLILTSDCNKVTFSGVSNIYFQSIGLAVMSVDHKQEAKSLRASNSPPLIPG